MPTIDGTPNPDDLSGTTGDDTVNGLGGNDFINDGSRSGSDTDTLDGGDGDDRITINDDRDTVIGGSGFDALGLDWELSASAVAIDFTALWTNGTMAFGTGSIAGIERLEPVLAGSQFNDAINVGAAYLYAVQIEGRGGNDTLTGGLNNDGLYGDAGNDVLVGGDGADILQGGADADMLIGGNGNDDYFLTDSFDTIIEAENGGFDFVRTTLEFYALGANLESLSRVGDSGSAFTGIGNSLNNSIVGGLGNDYLVGGDGNDTLQGIFGVNTLQGGTGDDGYFVMTAGDSIIEFAGEGTDHVFAGVAQHVLQANVENLTSTLAGSFLGIGNALDNRIAGSAFRDELYGLDGNDELSDSPNSGGGAADTLIGGNGNDVYLVSAIGSSTVELAGGGTDSVRMAFSIYQLQDNIEGLLVIDTGDHAALVGNAGDNSILGGIGADALYGRAGNDALSGGAIGAANTLVGQEGDDHYDVYIAGDSIVELAGEGNDEIYAYLSVFTMPANVEIMLGGFVQEGFTGLGNGIANLIRGGFYGDFLSGLDGDDILIGGGGADTLVGGNGADQFRYSNVDGIDTIVGFTSGSDKIALFDLSFQQTATVDFRQGAGAVATSANSTFFYDSATGIVSFDIDGTGAVAALALASVGTGLTLAAGDFIFV